MPPVKLSVADNPPDPEEVYPGKFSRNNPVGSVKDREEFLPQKTREWFQFVKENPKYKNMYLSDKTKVLMGYLEKFKVQSKKLKKVRYVEARNFLIQIESEIEEQDKKIDQSEGGNTLSNEGHGIEASGSNKDSPITSQGDITGDEWIVDSRDRSARTENDL